MADVDPHAPTRTVRPAAADEPAGPRAGDRVGRYVVERALGAGGMGVVVEARDPELQRQVALKLVRPDVGDRAYRARLVREARAMAKLEHPNVVRVYDAGEVGGEVFVAMELVVGRSLGAWLRALRRPWREVLARLVAAGRGLAAAHAAGMVHRDFKPENVLVRDSDGSVCVTDFGLAVAAGQERGGGGASSGETLVSGDDPTVAGGGPGGDAGATPGSTFAITRTGVAVGTPPYMAPEQHAGGVIDARADVFSFCVAVYEGVYGERPFEVEAARRYDPDAWVDAIARGPRPAPAGRRVPANLRRALVRGLAADPAARWPSMEPLLAALDAVLARRRRVLAALAAIAAVVAVVALTEVATGSPAAVDRCADEAARVGRVWGPGERAQISRALLATGKAYAPTAVARASESFDRWSTEWHDVRESTCRDASIGMLGGTEWRGVSSCLDDSLEDLHARVDLLAAGGDAVEHASDIASLTLPSACEHGADAPPTDPVQAAQVRAMRSELRAIEALGGDGKFRDAVARGRRLLGQARALGWRPLIDASAFALAEQEMEIGLDAEAEPLLREAAQSASARGDDAIASRAYITLLRLADETHRLDGLDYLVSAARAAAARTRIPRAELIVEAEIGIAYVDAGRIDEASTACERARGRIEAAAPDALGARERLIACLGLVAQARRQPAQQLRYAEELLAVRLEIGGPRHPVVADTLNEIGVILETAGHPADALTIYLTAQPVLEDTYGPRSGAVALQLSREATAHAELHDFAGARRAIDKASELSAGAEGFDARNAEEILRQRANVLDTIGDANGAVTALSDLMERVARSRPGSLDEFATTVYYVQALMDANRCADGLPIVDRTIAHATSLPEGPRIVLETVRANCRIAVGQFDDAAHDLDAAWRQIDRTQVAPPDAGNIVYTLARAYIRAGNAKAALAYAKQARAVMSNIPTDADFIPEIDDIIRKARVAGAR